jgi:hypothetical protein
VRLSGGSHLSEENDYMDDTSRDISLSSKSLECHPLRLNRDSGVIISLTFVQNVFVRLMDLFRSSAATFSGWWSLSLVFLSSFLWFITDNWYLSLIVQLFYPWDFSVVFSLRFFKDKHHRQNYQNKQLSDDPFPLSFSIISTMQYFSEYCLQA